MVNLLVPLAVTSYMLGARPVEGVESADVRQHANTTKFEQNLMFALGLGILVAVPVFKTVTHLPPSSWAFYLAWVSCGWWVM